MTDSEIANGLSVKEAAIIISCATVISQSIRNDVGSMFFNFFSEHVVFGTNFKNLQVKRGWIKVPPYHNSKTSKLGD